MDVNKQKMPALVLAQVEVAGHTRSAFLARATLATGAVYGLSAVTPLVQQVLAQEGGDVEILNFALTLEHLEAAFYTQAITRVNGLGGDAARIARELRDNEREHVDALRGTIRDLGGKPVDAPEVSFGKGFADEDAFLELAQTLEDTGVGAYNGAATAIQSKEVLAAAGSIVQVEARHAALIRRLREESPAPVAFDEALQKAAVLAAVQPFVKS